MHKFLLPHLKSLLTILALSLSLLTNAQTHDGDGIIYVKPAPTGIGDGSSWENATADLHNAIHIDGVQKVFVAVGEYKVGSNSFVMKNNVAIYGGFDPGNGITDLSHNRIMPSADNTLCSVLDGENVRPVIWNVFTSATAINNTAILDGFSITGGSYSNGAGIRNIYASPMLSNLVIHNNSATVTGAGIYNEYANPLISNTLICANTVSHSSPSPSVIYGAGMYNTNSSAPVLTNTTIVGNILKSSGAMGGAGIYNDNSCSPKIYNSIFWNNQINYNSWSGGADEEGADIESSGATFTLKNSITQTYDTGNSADNNKINVNPLFRSTTDFRLEIASPAINEGSSALYAELNADTKDLAGNYRVDGPEVDMGAYEYQLVPDATSIVYVKPAATGTGYGNSWDNATADLQRAINTRDVQKVFVATGNYNAPASSFVMKNGVAIYGGFDPENNIKTLDDRILPSLTVSGSVLNGENSKRVIYNNFTSATALANTAVLDGFTITGGNTANGGGIYNNYASPVLNNLVFQENAVTGNGGGVYNSNSAPSISNSVFKSNSANRGGAIFNGISSAPIVISNVTVTGNTAYQGGGILNENSGAVTLINIKLNNNTVSGSGSAMYSFNSSTTVSNAEVTGNTGNNGIVQNNTGNTTINNVTIANNGTYAMNIQNGGTVNINNAIVFGTLNGTGYTKQYSFIQGNTDTSNGNINTTGITVNDVFTNPSADGYTLKQYSPALNKGSNALYAGLDANSKDLTENPRLVGTAIDLGAYESAIVLAHTAGLIYVNADAQGAQDGSSWENATADLHNAIHIDGVQKVFVAVGEYKVGSNSFVMKNNVKIYGGFDPGNGIRDLSHNRILPAAGPSVVEGSILNGENARPVISNVFTSATAMNNTAVLDGFTIKNGYTTGSTYGGGISNTYASPTLRNLVVKNNKGDYGGGLSTSYGSPIVTDCIFTGNVAVNSGGGILNSSNSGTLAAPVFTNCIIMGNTASAGGGISNSWVSSTFINCAVTGNTATHMSRVGGVYNYANSSIVFSNSTIANNGSGINSYVSSGSSTLQNSIVWDNINGSYYASHSLIKDKNDTSNGNIDAAGLVADDIFTNPLGGDYTLKENSLAIDAGEEGFYAGLDENTKDLAGNARIYGFNGGGTLDLGAYESSYITYPHVTLTPTSGVIYVKETASGLKNGSSWANATNDLKRAIRIAGVQQVFTAIGNYPASYIVMKNNVAVYGGFDPDNGIDDLTDTRILPNSDTNIESTVLNGLDTKAVVWNNNNGLDNTAILDGFTLTNGRSSTGGGIYNNGASPTLSNLWINGNTATSDGGGMYNINSSSPVMTNVTVSNNTANYAGGIFNRNNSSPAMTNVTIKANTSVNDGGGMYNDVSASPALTNVSITGNTAKNGAGMYNRNNSSPILINTLLANNTATANGGAIRNEISSSPLLTNVTIANNTGSNTLYATDGSTSLANSIIYGIITGSYTAKNSLKEGDAGGTNGNLNGTGITPAQIFTNPTAGNYTLSEYSPAIDKGDKTLYAGLDGDTKDLADNTRVFKFTEGRKIDLGAYEYQGDPAPLPVTLIDFTAKAEGNRAKLQWQTDTETNNARFIIYRSGDEKEFVQIGERPGNGTSTLNSNYVFYDYSPLNGNNYYQLVQVDQNGKASELAIKNLNFGFQAQNIRLYPNPTQNHFTVSFEAGRFSQLELVNLNGKVLQREAINTIENSKTLSIAIYPAGIYMVKLGGKGQVESRKIIKK